MDIEIHNFITIWLIAAFSLIFVHQIIVRIPSGIPRFLSVIPIIYLFITLPLRVSSVHFSVISTIYITWLANFKLFFFSFNHGPLISTPPLSLFYFISICLLPIEPLSSKSKLRNSTSSVYYRLVLFLFKFGILASLVISYQFIDPMHPYLYLALGMLHMYLILDMTFSVSAFPVRMILGMEIEPQFGEPHLATSVQNLWGQRWNLAVSSLLRSTVYNPLKSRFTRFIGYTWARSLAIVATFAVSGLAHEVIYYYATRVDPTWEVTWYFILQGVWIAIEIEVKKGALARGWKLNSEISMLLTQGFLWVTGGLFFFPQIVRNGVDLKAFNEYWVFAHFVRDAFLSFLS